MKAEKKGGVQPPHGAGRRLFYAAGELVPPLCRSLSFFPLEKRSPQNAEGVNLCHPDERADTGRLRATQGQSTQQGKG